MTSELRKVFIAPADSLILEWVGNHVYCKLFDYLGRYKYSLRKHEYCCQLRALVSCDNLPRVEMWKGVCSTQELFAEEESNTKIN